MPYLGAGWRPPNYQLSFAPMALEWRLASADVPLLVLPLLGMGMDGLNPRVSKSMSDALSRSKPTSLWARADVGKPYIRRALRHRMEQRGAASG